MRPGGRVGNNQTMRPSENFCRATVLTTNNRRDSQAFANFTNFTMESAGAQLNLTQYGHFLEKLGIRGRTGEAGGY